MFSPRLPLAHFSSMAATWRSRSSLNDGSTMKMSSPRVRYSVPRIAWSGFTREQAAESTAAESWCVTVRDACLNTEDSESGVVGSSVHTEAAWWCGVHVSVC